MYEKCFMSGVSSETSLLHHLKLVDEYTQVYDDVYISDLCYRTVCGGDDQEVAKCWSIIKQTESAGFDEASVLHSIIETMRGIGFDLEIGVDSQTGVAYFVAIDRDALPTYNVVMAVRSLRPIPLTMAQKAKDLNLQHHTFSDWMQGRWVILDQVKYDPLPPHLQGAFLELIALLPFWVDLGVADPFLKMVNLQTVAGFELLRGNYL